MTFLILMAALLCSYLVADLWVTPSKYRKIHQGISRKDERGELNQTLHRYIDFYFEVFYRDGTRSNIITVLDDTKITTEDPFNFYWNSDRYWNRLKFFLTLKEVAAVSIVSKYRQTVMVKIWKENEGIRHSLSVDIDKRFSESLNDGKSNSSEALRYFASNAPRDVYKLVFP